MSTNSGGPSSSANYAETILQHTQDAAFIIRRDFRIVYVNPRASEVTGIAPDMLIGRPIQLLQKARIVEEDQLQQFQQAVVELIQGKRDTHEMTLGFRTKTMGTVRGHVRLSAVTGNERIEMVVGTVREISEEFSPRSADDLDLPYKTVVDQSPTGICICTDEAILYGNDRFQEMTGHDAQTLVGERRFTDFVHFGDQSRAQQILEDLMGARRVAAEFDCRIKRRDGTVQPAHLFASRLHYDGQPAVSLTVVVGRA